MANSPGQNSLVIERILRDRDGIWQQINEERDLRPLTVQMLISSAVSFAIFGLVLGASNSSPWQALSSMIKLPLLFLATLAICLPTLYLFNLVFGARLSMPQAVTLIMVSITVTAVLTLAFAPISLFFLITAQNYAFFKLLNVSILVLTALIGLRFLTGGMAALNERHEANRLAALPRPEPVAVPVPEPDRQVQPEPALVGAQPAGSAGDGQVTPAPDGKVVPATDGRPPAAAAVTLPAPVAAHPAPAGQPAPVPAGWPGPAPEPRPTKMGLVYIWILLFGFVGTQLAWTLRPFFGDPNSSFALFREIDGTFYSDILRTIGRLFGG